MERGACRAAQRLVTPFYSRHHKPDAEGNEEDTAESDSPLIGPVGHEPLAFGDAHADEGVPDEVGQDVADEEGDDAWEAEVEGGGYVGQADGGPPDGPVGIGRGIRPWRGEALPSNPGQASAG